MRIIDLLAEKSFPKLRLEPVDPLDALVDVGDLEDGAVVGALLVVDPTLLSRAAVDRHVVDLLAVAVPGHLNARMNVLELKRPFSSFFCQHFPTLFFPSYTTMLSKPISRYGL